MYFILDFLVNFTVFVELMNHLYRLYFEFSSHLFYWIRSFSRFHCAIIIFKHFINDCVAINDHLESHLKPYFISIFIEWVIRFFCCYFRL